MLRSPLIHPQLLAALGAAGHGARVLIDDRKTLMRVIRVLVAASALAAIYGLVQFLSGAAERASGPIPDPNDFAYMMVAVVRNPTMNSIWRMHYQSVRFR